MASLASILVEACSLSGLLFVCKLVVFLASILVQDRGLFGLHFGGKFCLKACGLSGLHFRCKLVASILVEACSLSGLSFLWLQFMIRIYDST